MFLGHFAVGLAAKKAAPQLSLGTLWLAAQWIDLIWPIFLLLGVEKVIIAPGHTAVTPFHFIHYPFTHSLTWVFIWAVLLGLICFGFRQSVWLAFILAGLVLSHWFLDLIVHRPDLPLSYGSDTFLGLSLWNSLP